MTDQATAYPAPHAEGLSAPYWNGTKRGALVVQRCDGCGKLRHYAQVLCTDCFSDAYSWIEVSGRGAVHSWTVCHHAFHPAFVKDLPYTLVTVDLDEGIRAMGRCSTDALILGQRVKATFPLRPDGFGQLTFLPE